MIAVLALMAAAIAVRPILGVGAGNGPKRMAGGEENLVVSAKKRRGFFPLGSGIFI